MLLLKKFRHKYISCYKIIYVCVCVCEHMTTNIHYLDSKSKGIQTLG
jgi:hypothetical protein